MKQATNIYRLQGVIQEYNWGGKRFLPKFLGVPNKEDKPFAEYWLGAHAKAPALMLHTNGKKQPLDEFIQSDIQGILGEQVANRFGRLPYLFKVLDVHDMLSIQVHPSKKAAEEDHAAESARLSNPDDPDRNYKDDNHKPEVMLARSEFWLLHGFKPKEALKTVLKDVRELNFLQPIFETEGYEGIYRKVMEMPQNEVNSVLAPLMERIKRPYEEGELTKRNENFWAARAFKTFCTPERIDRGIFSIYFFNIVHLAPGQAIFQDAGILHAYLEGQNLELMANSDNVLRGGLTQKRIDVPELLKHVRFEAVHPNKIQSISSGDDEVAFRTTAEDFELRLITVSPAKPAIVQTSTADVFLVTEGTVTVKSSKQSMILKKGNALIAIAGTRLELVSGSAGAQVFRATVPE